jgi:pseudouridine synthase
MIGRLDRESEGLMLLTNDGQLAHRLMHPSFNIDRIYEVETIKPITESQIGQILAGVSLDDGISRAKSIEKLSERQIRITLTEGRNRQIRRTLAHIGHHVNRLVRIEHGPYRLAGLEPGSWQEIKIETLS